MKSVARSFSLPHINSPVEEDEGLSTADSVASSATACNAKAASGCPRDAPGTFKDHLRSKFKFHAHVHAQDSNSSLQV